MARTVRRGGVQAPTLTGDSLSVQVIAERPTVGTLTYDRVWQLPPPRLQ